MEMILCTLGCIVLIVGLILGALSLRYRSDKVKASWFSLTFNPRHWNPYWKMQDYYTPKGFRYQLWGVTLILIAAVILIITGWIYRKIGSAKKQRRVNPGADYVY